MVEAVWYLIRGISMETKEKQWLMVGADYTLSNPEGNQLRRFLDVQFQKHLEEWGQAVTILPGL